MAEFVVISSAPAGYRRAGVVLAPGPNVLDTDDFSEEQLAQLRNDPRLTVAEGDDTDTGADTVVPKRLAALVEHIKGLDKTDESLWKEDGIPKASAYPKGTTAEEREAAWDAFTKTLDGAE